MPLNRFWIALAAFAGFAAAAGNSFCVTVRTGAPHNPQARVWCRVPAGYDAGRRAPYPVLVYFGGRNCSGEAEASGRLGWAEWADEHGVFLVAPGFRDDDYWNPEAWSGRALLDALSEIGRDYRIDGSSLLYYGYSAVSQASNLFPSWRPRRCRAWVSHACGVFHEPRAAMRDVPGLVTCGDADAARYVVSRDFVARARRRGIDIIWKSFPNHPHDVPPDSLRLACAFLAHHLSAPRGGVEFVCRVPRRYGRRSRIAVLFGGGAGRGGGDAGCVRVRGPRRPRAAVPRLAVVRPRCVLGPVDRDGRGPRVRRCGD